MPSYQATAVTCPECGARLEVPGDAPSATCQYCGTVSRVQRRTQFFQIPVRLPPAATHEPQRVARQVRSSGGKWVLAITLFCGLGIPVLVIGGLIAGKLGAFDSTYWDGSHLAIADVNGDGVDDFIGLDRNIRKDQMSLAAFSGKDGKQIWKTPALGTYNDIYQDKMVVAGELVVLTDQTAHIDGFDVKTGAKRWRATASEVATPCKAASPMVKTKDGNVFAVGAADGKLTAASTPCEEVDAGFHPAGGATEIREHRHDIKIDGMSVDSTYARGDGPQIAIGNKSPGTSIPMVAALDASGKMLWKAEVPGHDPLTASTGRPKAIAIGDKDVAVVYERSKNKSGWELTVFDRATGARKFEVPGKKTTMKVVSFAQMSRTAVAVSTWGSLQVFDLASGKLMYTIGE